MKKKTLLFHSFILFIFIFNLSCGSSKDENKNLELNIKTHYFYSWLNLMPGGPHSFHFTSILLIELNESINYDLIKINKVIVKQGENIINEFIPLTDREVIVEEGKEKLFLEIYSPAGVPVPDKLDPDQRVEFLYLISEGEENPKTMIHTVRNISIEKTY